MKNQSRQRAKRRDRRRAKWTKWARLPKGSKVGHGSSLPHTVNYVSKDMNPQEYVLSLLRKANR